MQDCIFCKIVAGEAPSCTVDEDKDTLAFLDINQFVYGKTLVIPREHFELLTDVPQDLLGRLINTTQRVAAAVVKGTGAQGFNILQSNGACAGQEVPHVHFHIVPRQSDDGLQYSVKRRSLSDAERNEVADKIRPHLSSDG